MKNLRKAFFLYRDKHTESLKPLILNTLARCVFFPDGDSLLEKWEKDIQTTMLIKHDTEDVTHEGSIYRWSCLTYGETKFQLSTRVRPSIAVTPDIVEEGGDATGSFIITKIDEDGNKVEEEIQYGSTSAIHKYTFVIPLPSNFSGKKTMDTYNSSINVTEGNDSTFMKNSTIHNVVTECSNGNLFIHVYHYDGMDTADLSGLSYITGDFSITVNGLFN